jgi:2-succinyl-5-enolpyruvyl-6-hydroxy-3-cyclohexene-1-carboxylate synthase
MNPQNRTAIAISTTLAAGGVRHVVASPGSRHTPLLLALANHPDLTVSMHHDERSAGFFALGIGKVTGVPAALICTSGSALSHYLPAIIEADLASVPMIVISADRPHELWETGAPQTINQRHIFGSKVRQYASIDPNGGDDPRIANLNSWLSAHWLSASIPTPGPVHLNVELREPLLPEQEAIPDGTGEIPTGHAAANAPEIADTTGLVASFATSQRPLIVAGRLSDHDARAVEAFGASVGTPILADPQSGLRSPNQVNTIAYADILAATGFIDRNPPDLVIRCGPIPTSKPIWSWLGDHPEIPQYVVTPSGVHDPMGSATEILRGDIAASLTAVAGEVIPAPTAYREWWTTADETVAAVVSDSISAGPLTEPAIGATVAATCSPGDIVFVGSSMPIRDLDSWGGRWSAARTIANRGANGIDGAISTALGIATASNRHVLAYLGDTTALHDIGALASVARLNANLTVVIANNNGGGIFHHLAQGDPENLDPDQFERLFGAPHDMSFATLARAFGMAATTVTSIDELSQTLSAHRDGPLLVEVPTSRCDAVNERRRLLALVRSTVM